MKDLTQQRIRFHDESGADVFYDVIHYFTSEEGDTYIFTVLETSIDDEGFREVIPYRVSLDDEGWIDEIFALETDAEWSAVEAEWERLAEATDDWPEEA
ncbi:MAG TPA: DUF1292 domain-containing protein [Haloplasmataceae bacterium]